MRQFVKCTLIIVASLPFLLTILYAILPPPSSSLMLIRSLNGVPIHKKWRSLDSLSPFLLQAVIAAEDARFCRHHGVDWVEFYRALIAFDLKKPSKRGASTISMQTAKNLFLWEGRSPLRKSLEIPLALWMDLFLSKRRMLEIYLNIAEWGPGIYGAQTAARHYFNKSAQNLTAREAALLAALLPSPLKRRADRPSPSVSLIAQHIRSRMRLIAPYLTCLK